MKVIRLAAGRERSLLRRHPWIFESAIAKGRADAGETLEISETPGNQGADGAADTQDKGTNNTQEQTGAALASDQQTEGKQAQTQQAPNAPKDGQQQPAAKKESEYQKFLKEKEQLQKEKQRLANTWQQVQAEKGNTRTEVLWLNQVCIDRLGFGPLFAA